MHRLGMLAGAGVLMMATAAAAPATAQTSDWTAPVISGGGIIQERTQVVYGFAIENPNQDVATSDLEIETAVYDAGGTLLKSSTTYLEWLPPGQRVSVSSSTFLSEGQQAAAFDIHVKDFKYRPGGVIPADGAQYVADRFSSAVTGTLHNPYPKTVTDLRVSALAYDSAGTFIGGGSTFLATLPAGGAAAVRVTVTTHGTPARVELSAAFSAISGFRD